MRVGTSWTHRCRTCASAVLGRIGVVVSSIRRLVLVDMAIRLESWVAEANALKPLCSVKRFKGPWGKWVEDRKRLVVVCRGGQLWL